MYHEISKETGEFFGFMADHELFDLETKTRKTPRWLLLYLIEGYNAPFIFSNFNGTCSADVDVLTMRRDMFEAYTAAPAMPIQSMVFPDHGDRRDPFHEHGDGLSMDEGFLWGKGRRLLLCPSGRGIGEDSVYGSG